MQINISGLRYLLLAIFPGETMDHECTEGAQASATDASNNQIKQHCNHDDPNIHDDHGHHDDLGHHDDHLHHDDDDYCHHGDHIHLRIPSRSPQLSTSSEEDFEKPSLFVTPSTTGDMSAAPSRGHSKTLIIQPPNKAAGGETLPQLAGCVSPTSGQPLSLDLSLESITRYQAKPDSMYTFLCAQVNGKDKN